MIAYSLFPLDEAAEEMNESFQSTNEIIDDVQSTNRQINETSLVSSDDFSADNAYKNAFHVFRALCKLSDRDIKDKNNVDPR